MGPIHSFDLRPLFWLAMVGIGALVLVALIGVPLLGYWLWTHLQWVP